MDSNTKWMDVEDERTFDETETRIIHKKLLRKSAKLAEELQSHAKSKFSDAFTSWAQSEAKPVSNSNAGKLLQSESILQVAKPKTVAIKKIAQTVVEDSLNAVVQTIDKAPKEDTFCFAGFDKVLKVMSLGDNKGKHYHLDQSIYLEGLPMTRAKFVTNDCVLLSFQKKPFVSFLDVATHKNTPIYKLFEDKNNVEFVALNPARTTAVVCTKDAYAMIDTRRKLVTSTAVNGNKITDACFVEDHTLAIANEHFSVKLFDLRKSSNIPIHVLNTNSSKIAGGNGFLAAGTKTGLVKVFNAHSDYSLVKTFDQLTTEITDISMNDSYLAFASKWKKNNVRVAMLNSMKILPGWPNVKTNLNIVNSLLVDDKDRVLIGTSFGVVHVYQMMNN